jgi:hypothetical protein
MSTREQTVRQKKEITMKSSILRSLVVTAGLGAAFGPVALMAQSEIRITIPFDFTIGAKSLAAGEYSVQAVRNNLFLIRNLHDRTGSLTLTMPGDEPKRGGFPVLTFNRYGDSYFLNKVSDGSRSWDLPRSSGEKVQIAKKASPKPVAVASALASK